MEAVWAGLTDAGIFEELESWLALIADLRSCSLAPLTVCHMARAVDALVFGRVEPESLHTRLACEHIRVALVAESHLASGVGLALRLVAAHYESYLADITEIESTLDTVCTLVNLAYCVNALTSADIEAEPICASRVPALVFIEQEA